MKNTPIILSTWSFGQAGNNAAWQTLNDQSALDAVQEVCLHCENDPNVLTVGQGGYPDRSGQVTLDAAIMTAPNHAGSVCYVRRFQNPITIARYIMENTNHILFAGQGAEGLAKYAGLNPADPTTPRSKKMWQEWIEKHPEAAQDNAISYMSAANMEEVYPDDPETLPHNQFHDTVGTIALDNNGLLAGACSTSGLAYKVPGRVGDSPIIGQGLYVDPKHGAAVATGDGELVMAVCGAFLAVENMRNGKSPLDAAVAVLERIVETHEIHQEHQVGIITLTPTGEYACAALRPGFRTAVKTADFDQLVEPMKTIFENKIEE